MNKSIVDAVKEIEEIHKEMGKDYIYVNINNENILAYDYSQEQIPIERVKADKNKILKILNTYANNIIKDDIDNFAILYAIYCNIYIKWGFWNRLDNNDNKSDFFLTKYIKDNKYSYYFKNILYGIRDQNYKYFENLLESNPNCKIANIYLFIKYATDFCYELSINENCIIKFEDKMWSYYEKLDSDLKYYVIGKGKYHKNISNLAGDLNYIPYIDFKSIKEHLMDSILKYYLEIKENLKIKNVRSSYISNEIFNRMFSITKNIKSENIKKSQYNLIFLFEKLDYLSLNLDKQWNTKFEKKPLKDNSIASRNDYLHIPQNVFEITSKHFIDKYKIYCVNKEFKKIESKFKNLIEDLNKYTNVDDDEISLDQSMDRISKFLKDISKNKIKYGIYYEKYENELNKLIVNYKDKLNQKTISDIEVSRDLSRIAPEKMDLILMPIFRSIEEEITTRVFGKFFNKFRGLNINNKFKNLLFYENEDKKEKWIDTENKFNQKNTTLGSILHYDKEFLDISKCICDKNNRRPFSFYFRKFMNDAGCIKNYYEMIELMNEYEYNKLNLAKIRNAIAHREEETIDKFTEDILYNTIEILVKIPNGVFFNLLEIDKALNKYLEIGITPSKNSRVEIYLDNTQYCFELNGFIYKCTKPQDLNKDAVVVEYIDKEKRWKVK